MIRRGLMSFRGPGAQVITFAITAPGSERGHLERGGWVLDSAESTLAWNAQAPRAWTALNSRIQAMVRRRYRWDDGSTVCKVLVRWWEYQARGALHLHGCLPYESLSEKRAADVYLKLLRARAHEHGFGWVDSTNRVLTREAAGGHYATAYAKGRHGKTVPLSEAVKRSTCPRQPVYVENRLKALGLCSMRELRLYRFLIAALHLVRDDANRVLRCCRMAIPERDRVGRVTFRKMTWRESVSYLRVRLPGPQELLAD